MEIDRAHRTEKRKDNRVTAIVLKLKNNEGKLIIQLYTRKFNEGYLYLYK